jgi:uroporphyrinogen-III synthase
MPPALADLLHAPAIVLLHSGEAARHFAALCSQHGVARTQLSLAAIGPRVVEAAGDGWQAVAAAARPNDAALLALTRQMCQTSGSETFQDRA